MLLPVDFEEDFIQVPFVARLRAPQVECVSVSLAELAGPLSDRFVADDDAAGREDLFDLPIAQREAEVEPYGMSNDFGGEAVAFVGGSRSGGHVLIIPGCGNLAAWRLDARVRGDPGVGP